MEKAFVPLLSKHGIMGSDGRVDHGLDGHHVGDEQDDDIGSLSSFSDDDDDDDDDEGSVDSVGSSSSVEFTEDAASSSGSSSSNGPLFEMSSLVSQLPFKRGLSKHFEGKSQSFTSLCNVKSLEDLIKPERSFKKRQLKSSKSYGWGLDRSLSPKNSISKKSSKGSFSSLGNMKRRSSSSFVKPPFPPQRSGSPSGQTLLETIG
ncbi:uncharacterized protein A4U43_C04F5470 [Asparagus officinalis]|uniref:Uncharacterized protein n=1 Tax=Asparagus officinalis TaxID=4686 RepID=A0A5P1EZ59_ASPOF|nr:uncharacterized protein LOC109836675 [Asparagus officinalis]ONK71164.1 uncharacterized protein A4U43_C04F5470 [Asparagus officinalis]